MKYCTYGICIDSDFALRGVPEVLNGEPPLLRLKFMTNNEVDASYSLEYRESIFQGRRVLTGCDDESDDYVFNVDGVASFRINRTRAVISCQLAPHVADELLCYWLLRYMVPFYLAFEGPATFFHGSAVKVRDGAVGFLAESFGGKSTLANYLQQQGHPLVTDDDLLVDGEGPFLAVPSIPFIRTCRSQEVLGIRVERFANRPVPLRKLYILGLSEAPASVISLSKIEGVAALLQQNRFRFVEKLTQRFRFCVRLASSIRISRLVMPRALSRLEEVHQTLLIDLEECP
jgi:hypothetical protein